MEKIVYARGFSWWTMFVAFLAFTGFAQAQNSIHATFRPSVNFPTESPGDVELKNGGGFEAIVSYRFIPALGVYAGWGWNTFGIKKSVGNSNATCEETGYSFGLQSVHPLSSKSNVDLIFNVGAILNHIETENDAGDIVADTGHDWGWQADAGLSIPLNYRWQIIPSIRYHALSASTTAGGIETSSHLRYFSVGVGVSWTLFEGQ
jgi:hypothetical protein